MSRIEVGPLHAELPWFGYASDGIVLTKRGELLAGARLRGAPFECRAPDDLDSVALRWTLALKSLVPGWRIRWQARKRRLAALPQRPAGDALLERAQNARNDALIGKGLYSIEASVYWVWDPRLSPQPPRKAGASWARSLIESAGLWLAPDRTRRLLAGQVAEACERFENAVAAFRGLVDDVTPLEPLLGGDLFHDLALSANSREAADTARSLGSDGLDRQLALSDLEAHRDHLLVGGERVETYALLDPPSVTRAHLFGGILDLEAELDLAVEWRREDAAASGRRIRGARRHYHQKRFSMMAHASGDSGSPQARGALEDRAAEAEANQLGEALRELEVEGLPFGEYSLCGDRGRASWTRFGRNCCALPPRPMRAFTARPTTGLTRGSRWPREVTPANCVAATCPPLWQLTWRRCGRCPKAMSATTISVTSTGQSSRPVAGHRTISLHTQGISRTRWSSALRGQARASC